MKISPIRNISFKNNISGYHLRAGKEDFLCGEAQKIYENINLVGNIRDINNKKYPDNLYLDLDKLYETLERKKSYERFEDMQFILSEMVAKRCNYLGITECARGDFYGSIKAQSSNLGHKYLSVSECFDKKRNAVSIDFDWTKSYTEIENFFKGTKSNPIGAQHDMELIKEGLPRILKKQGWIK